MAAQVRVVIDAETRSRLDLTVVGASRYARHESTIPLCLGYKLPDGTKKMWVEGEPPPQDLFDAIANGALVYAHNTLFERNLWEWIFVPRMGWPAVPVSQWRDSMAQGNAIGLPSKLEEALPAAGAHHEKDMQGHRIMLKLAKPRRHSKHDKRDWFDDPEDFQKLYTYCMDDVIGEDELIERTYSLTPEELEVWQFDQEVNQRGTYVDRKAVLAALDLIEQIMYDNEAELEILTAGRITTAGQRDRILEYVAELGYPLPDMTADTVVLALKKLAKNTKPNALIVRRILEIRQENGKSSTKKFVAMLDRLDEDDRIRGYLQYCGAFRTGRWAGRGVQIHNLPRGEFAKRAPEIVEMILARDLDGLRREFGNPMSAISTAIRAMFMAAPGHELVCADYNAIEARGVFWLSNDKEGLNVFHSGRDPYKDMASTIFGVHYDKITDDQRFVGKQAILGLGYRMGWKKFMAQCESYGQPISEELAKRVVDTYRARFWRVVEFWDEIERAAINAIQYPGYRFRVDIHHGYVEYFMAGSYLMCKLPGGRCIGYPDAELRDVLTPWGQEKLAVTYMGKNSYNNQWERLNTHGGTLVENITQAVARDLLALAMLRLEKNHYPIVIHVHDECVAEVLEGTGNLKFFCHIMEQNPKWAKGFPVKAEGWIGRRYKKG